MKAVPFDALTLPKLRAGVDVQATDHALELRYGDQGCTIEAESGRIETIGRLIDVLKDGQHDVARLAAAIPELEDELADTLRDLDDLGLLEEGSGPLAMGVISGRQLYREVIRFTDRIRNEVASSRFMNGMRDGEVTREILIGYALEYFHLVHLAPRLVAPALAKAESRQTQAILQNFYVSELNHDRMLESSLGAVGYSSEQLELSQPLPTTFALCASLAAYATQHPLSFKAALFLFETPDAAFNETFRDRCVEVGLPEAFWAPILRHATINDDYDHGDVSNALLSDVSCVSPEEQVVVLKHLGILVETIVKQEAEIFAYYGGEKAIVPRIFA